MCGLNYREVGGSKGTEKFHSRDGDGDAESTSRQSEEYALGEELLHEGGLPEPRDGLDRPTRLVCRHHELDGRVPLLRTLEIGLIERARQCPTGSDRHRSFHGRRRRLRQADRTLR